MELTINQQKKNVNPAPSSLGAVLLTELPASPKGIAVALNNQVIPRDQWNSTEIRDKDAILIVTATQGG